jgi:hypothetical protein
MSPAHADKAFDFGTIRIDFDVEFGYPLGKS